MVVATPAAAAMVSAALTFLVTVVLKASEDAGAELIKQQVKQLFRSAQKEKSPSLTLTPEQLAQLKQTMHDTVRRFGVDKKQANQMSDAFVLSLVLPPTKGNASSKTVKA